MTRVLIVEDDDVIRESMRELLELEGFDVVTAANGREALEAVHAARPCVVLLDLFMPVMDGWQFLAELDRDRELANLPVTVVSAAGDRVSGIGGRRFLRKPATLSALVAAVRASCAGHPVVQPGRAVRMPLSESAAEPIVTAPCAAPSRRST